MAADKLTEYERKRIENIKRNAELLASLNIKSKISDLSASSKRHRVEAKSYKLSPDKKLKLETPTVVRRSLRNQGIKPDSVGLKDDFSEPTKKSLTSLKSNFISNMSPKEKEPISMSDASTCTQSDDVLANKILSVWKMYGTKDGNLDSGEKCSVGVKAAVDLRAMKLESENVARVVPNRILSVKFFPSADMRMVAVGNKFGNVGFWNLDAEGEDGDGIYMYHPHPGPVSSILIQPFSLNKIITSCYDGQIRSLDIEKQTFGLSYTSEHAIFSMAQRLNDVNSLYFGEGRGAVRVWDERSGKSSFTWDLHDSRINTIDFNPENINMVATSSSDGTACIWDLRKLCKSKPKSLKLISRERAVHSAYFSPSGCQLATTSFDDKIGVLSGANYDDEFLINHNNQTGRWLSSFKGVWGWDDSYIFVGNMKRGVNVISTDKKTLVTTLESPHMTAIPCRFDAHPFKPGMLAGATSGGQVYVWAHSGQTTFNY